MFTLLLILLILVYLILVLRYYYRTSDAPITIIQCDVHSFRPTLLQERQPIVCKDVGSIAAVQDFAREHVAGDNVISKTISTRDATVTALYESLSAGAWYHQHERAALTVQHDAADRAPSSPRQSWYDILMTIQLRGTRRVRIYAPAETPRLWRVCAPQQHPLFCNSERVTEDDDDDETGADGANRHSTAQYMDIVLSEGDALLLPMQWWIDDAPAAVNSMHAVDTGHVNLGWRNPFSRLHAVARNFL